MLSASDLMRQAMDTAHDYMLHAEHDIDEHFGAGFARQNPALMAAYMQTAATDFAATFGLQGVSESVGRVADAVGDVADALDKK